MKLLWAFAILISSIVLGQKTFLENNRNIQVFRAIKDMGLNMIGSTSANGSAHLDAAKNQGRVQGRIPDSTAFPCNVSAGRSKRVPRSVHKLRPGDIDVIGAIGDSLTAGSGIFATNIFQLIIENRGATVLGGGQGTWRDYLTIPNILKEFNPNLIGYSTNDSASHRKESQLNVAEIAAMSRDLPYMARNIVERIKNNPNIDIDKHWKLISILIGNNDFCSDMCYTPSGPWSILEKHRSDLMESLRILKENLPRTMVSIIPPPNAMLLLSLKERSPLCTVATGIECSCMLGMRWESQRDEFERIMTRWQEIDEEIANYPEFHTNDFTVVVQPFATNLTFPKKMDGSPDWRYLSSDCFHLSQVGNARAAVAIWKNMLELNGEKSRNWEEYKGLECPSKYRSYLATAENSYTARNNILNRT